ncbi:CD59 glycoprotein-like [Megalops cyprinoides]|uniref:CD59 glycoprotein-like n=1 Tax=Megalops cyprinoides TaxID=118141 RepID=UPI0018648634|nr:CD59 glycoprotein-like [Megalops cyprinoides]
MKALVITFFLLLALSCGEALRCNHCVPSTPGGRCTTTLETCRPDHDACIRAMFLPPLPISHFRRCIKMSDCMLLQGTPNINAYCCSSDRCN